MMAVEASKRAGNFILGAVEQYFESSVSLILSKVWEERGANMKEYESILMIMNESLSMDNEGGG
jgi:hypothetical protein